MKVPSDTTINFECEISPQTNAGLLFTIILNYHPTLQYHINTNLISNGVYNVSKSSTACSSRGDAKLPFLSSNVPSRCIKQPKQNLRLILMGKNYKKV